MQNTVRVGFWPLLLIIIAASFVPVFSQEQPKEVGVELSLEGDVTRFRAGEPIRLVLSFTASAEGYQLNTTTTKTASPIDDVRLTPMAGVFRWLAEYSGRNRYYPDYAAMTALSAKPVRVVLPINDWYRFDKPGKYSVRVVTNRVSHPPRPLEQSPAIQLTTN